MHKQFFRNIMEKVYRQKPWNRAVTTIAAVIVFITTYMLILPAITLTPELICPYEENHVHTEACYRETMVQRLACPYAGTQDVIILHTHDAACYLDGVLVCPLPERKGHTHTGECYIGGQDFSDGSAFSGGTEQPAGTDFFSGNGSEQNAAVAPEGGSAPVCGMEEIAPHQHGAGCYDNFGNLICKKPVVIEHQHGAECFADEVVSRELICGQIEGHVHTDTCYEKNSLIAGLFMNGDKAEDVERQQEAQQGTDFTGDDPGLGADVVPAGGDGGAASDDPAAAENTAAAEYAAGMDYNAGAENTVAAEYAAADHNAGEDHTTGSDHTVVSDHMAAPDHPAGADYVAADGVDGMFTSDVNEVVTEPEPSVNYEGSGLSESEGPGQDGIAGLPDTAGEADGETPAGSELTGEFPMDGTSENAADLYPDAAAADSTDNAADAGMGFTADEGTGSKADEGGESTADEGTGFKADESAESKADEGTESIDDDRTEDPAVSAEGEATSGSADAVTVFDTQDIMEEPAETTTEYVSDKGAEGSAETVDDFAAEETTEGSAEAVTEFDTEGSAETTTESDTEGTTEGSAETTTEADTEETTEGSAETTTEFDTETTTEASTETTTETVQKTVEETTELTTEWTDTLVYRGTDYTVRLTYDNLAGIPEDAELSAEEIPYGTPEYENYLAQARAELALPEDKEIPKELARFFDIRILAADGEIEPTRPVRVEIIYDKPVEAASQENTTVDVLHFDEAKDEVQRMTLNPESESIEIGVAGNGDTADLPVEGAGENETAAEKTGDTGLETLGSGSEDGTDIDLAGENVKPVEIRRHMAMNAGRNLLKLNSDEPENANADSNETAGAENAEVDVNGTDGTGNVNESYAVVFTAESFSVYGVIYTVDFHWEVNGKMYDFSMPGGGFISFSDLIEVLGVAKTGENDDVHLPGEVPGIDNQDENGENQGVEEPENIGNSDTYLAGEVSGIENQDATGESNPALILDGVVVSEDTWEFVADVESVVFSNPALVDVSKVDGQTTVGGIKERRGLEVQYSAELTEEQIAEINGTIVESGDWALISMQPFESTESLTVTMKTGEVFEIRVTDAQLKKTIKTAKGETWEITITYDDNAEIPEGAELKVEEILPEDERYEQYYQQSLEKIGVVAVSENTEDEADLEAADEAAEAESEEASATTGYAHIFDIQIWAGDQQIEPASDVAVIIKLLDAPEDEDTNLQVVHFGKDGLEVMELAENNEKTKAEGTELNFATDEFSVYSVVNVTSSTNIVNNGPYVLVTGIADNPGATTGYTETYDGVQMTDYFTIIVNAQAMMGKDGVVAIPETNDNTSWVEKTKGLGAEGVHAWTDSDGNNYVGGGATQWQFESVGYGRYRIFTNDNGSTQYITHNNAEVSLTNNQWNATAFSVTRNNDGTVLIHDGNMYLHNNSANASGDASWSAWVNHNYILKENSSAPSDNEYKFRLCKESDGFEPQAAKKVAASTITTNANYVIYRKFEDAQGKEALYALAHDGTFVRVYDGGDTIYWRETDKNIYWNYQMDGNYPVLLTQNPSTHETIYINPNHSTGQTLSTTPGGLTLIGKDNGEYSTAIESWDQTAYDYAGLHVTQNNDGTASLSTGTRVAGTSDEFLFAVASEYPGTTAETVDTVDSDSLGIKITMFDYGEWDNAYAAGTKLDDMTAIAGSAEYTPHAAHALVKPYLESGLPSGTAGAMTGLFSSGGAIKSSKENVNHLFLQSYYDESGTFRYRSEDNYAYLKFEDGEITGTDFTVYRQAATPYTTDAQPGHTYYHHGHFMPFNDIDMNNNLSRLMNQYGNEYTNGTAVGEIPLEDGRTYEDIYGIQGIPNYYTGMKMEANFSQPRDGKLENGDEMIFKFTGDDDMWVYIDGVLVLDIGGIHEPLSGTINFATGQVTNPAGSSLAGTKTLYQIFQDVLTASGTPQEVKDKINSITWKDVNGDGTPDTFADYTNHSFSAFYMERGAGASNLDIQFNLKVVLTKQFTVEKEIPDDVDDRFDNQVYKFQATYMDSNNQEQPLHAVIANVCTSVVYRDKYTTEIVDGKEVKVPVPVSVDENGYFYLRAGEAAVFMMADESIKYNVKEVDLDQYNLEKITINGDEVTEHVEINDQQATIIDNAAVAGYDEVGDRSNVLYTNYPKTQDLLITKHIHESSAPLEDGENPVFEFRVYLESTEVKNDGTTERKLVPYSYGPYYLTKEVDGATHYFTLTGVNNAPVDKGTTPVVCSTTGRSGSINSIPPEYTIVIPNLVVGTNFYVEERFDNIPEGYEFVSEDLKEGTYDENNLGTTAEIIDHVLPRDQSDHQEFDSETVGRIKQDVDAECHVYNRKPAVIITVEKEWDPEPEDGTTVTVELRRYAKIIKGTISVTLYDNNEAPIEGAVFELYKDGEATGTEVTTNVNGIASVSGLEAGAYKLVQKSTPAGYSMDGHTTETGTLTVVDNVTTPQTLNESLTNTALVTAGKVTLTLTDSGAGSGTAGTPIAGATYTLYKDGSVYSSGHQTNSEGKVVIGNLGAGEYYLVQTATTADYNLPNVTRTASFTVVENPGVTQEFTQSMTNSLKGKGTVSLALTKEGGGAVSGASFQLKTGNTVLETKQTGSDGTLTFDTVLYEGTYTVHQVNTGSAGDDYATAADQTITIQANSETNQQQSLTFVSEEATGNVSIVLMRKYGKTDGDQWNQISTITGLRPGQSYSFVASTNNSVMIDQNHIWYFEAEDSYSNGIAPDSSNIVTWDRSLWTISEGTATRTFTFTPTNNNTTYTLALITDWSVNDLNLEYVSTRSLSNTYGSNRQIALPAANMRTLPTLTLMTTSGTTRSVTHTNASPASAPEGYAEDSTFEAIEVILPTVDGWRYTFDAQDKFDADGNPYYYYIVETNCSDPDYWIDSYEGDEELNDTGTITVTNKKETTGSLIISKTVKMNAQTDTTASGTYYFGVYNDPYTEGDDAVATTSIMVSSGTGSVTVPDLTLGNYVVYELTGENGTPITTGGSVFGTKYYTVTAEGNPATVSASSTAEVSITNKYETVNKKAKKNWPTAQTALPAGTKVNLTMTATVVGETAGATAAPHGVTVSPAAVELDGTVDIEDPIYETTAWEYEWTDLPKYDLDGKEITYTVTETGYQIGSISYNTADADTTPTTGYDFSFTNDLPTVDISATKQWKDKDGNVLDGTEGKEYPANAKVTFTLLADDTVTSHAVEVNGVDETKDPDTQQAITPATTDYEGADWTAYFTGLPKYTNDGELINYTVKETGTWPGFAIEGDDTVSSGGTIINKQLTYNLKIVKVAKGTTTGLTGAKFQLTRKLDGEGSFTRFEHDQFDEVAGENGAPAKKNGPFEVTSTDGIRLTGLLPGKYQIQETKAPDGYIITLSTFEFEIKADGTIEPTNGDGTTLVQYLAAEGTDPAGFQIENEPGAALPNTGGSGTNMIYLLGSILLAFASTGLLMRRKRRAIK